MDIGGIGFILIFKNENETLNTNANENEGSK